jgi:septum formation protein
LPADLDEDAYMLAEPLLAAINVGSAKARAIASGAEADEVVVAADTLVVIDGDILAKPMDARAARAMLARLCGRDHQVLTGVVLRSARMSWSGVVETRVVMRDYTAAEVEAYVVRGEPFDKAGGYAVQDQVFRPVEGLEGCYLNVVGLPLCAVAAGLNALGVTEEVISAGPPPCTYCARGEPLVRSGY